MMHGLHNCTRPDRALHGPGQSGPSGPESGATQLIYARRATTDMMSQLWRQQKDPVLVCSPGSVWTRLRLQPWSCCPPLLEYSPVELRQKWLLTFFYTDTDSNKCISSPCGAEDFWPFWFWCVLEQTRMKRKEGEGPTSCLNSLLMSLFLLTA